VLESNPDAQAQLNIRVSFSNETHTPIVGFKLLFLDRRHCIEVHPVSRASSRPSRGSGRIFAAILVIKIDNDALKCKKVDLKMLRMW
jgi:hypothetical protein